MFFQPFLVDSLNILNGENGSIVGVFGVIGAVMFVCINFRKHLKELFPCMVDVPQQFIVEMQDASSVTICGTPVVHINVGVQFLFNVAQSFRHIGIDGTPDDLCQSRPGIDLDGGDLHQRQKEQNQTAPAS